MAVTASSISSSNTLEQLRTQFNNLVSDVTGLEAGSQTFTLITSSNITVAEDGTIVFEGATNDDFETTLTVVDPTADRTITLPNETGTVLTTASSVTATNVTVSANNSTDETIFLTFVDGATGTQGLETDTGLTYNPSTGTITATNFSGNLTDESPSSHTLVFRDGSASFDGSARLDLDGTAGNFADLPDNGDFNILDKDFTIETFIKPDTGATMTANQTLFAKHDRTNNNNYTLRLVGSNSNVGFVINDG